MKLELNEKIEDLQLNNLKIIQNKELYNFTSDSALLANFVSAKKTDNILEIGCGCGVISILVNEKCKPNKITAVEIQKPMFDLAKKNIELNNLSDKIEVIHSKIQDYKTLFAGKQFDVVFSNPPYLKISNSTLLKENEVKANCRHEVNLTLEELIFISSKLLKFGGKLFLVYRSERLSELFAELNKNNLEPKKLFFVSPSNSSCPELFLLEARKGAKPGLKVLPTLITNDKNGNYLFTVEKLYKNNFNWQIKRYPYNLTIRIFLWYISFQLQLEI